LNLALDGGKWSASRPDRFTLRERAPGIHWIGVGISKIRVKIIKTFVVLGKIAYMNTFILIIISVTLVRLSKYLYSCNADL